MTPHSKHTTRRTHATRRRAPKRQAQEQEQLRPLDDTGRWFEDVVTGDLVEQLTDEEAAELNAYMAGYTSGYQTSLARYAPPPPPPTSPAALSLPLSLKPYHVTGFDALMFSLPAMLN